MNRKSGRSSALKATKLLQKTKGSTYNLTYKRLRRQLEDLQLQVAEGHILLAKHCERQKCLLDLILHQDTVLQYLQLQQLQPGNLSACGLAAREQVCREQLQDAASCGAQCTPQHRECSRQQCQQSSPVVLQELHSSQLQNGVHLQEQHLQQQPPHPRHQQQQEHLAAPCHQEASMPTQEAASSHSPGLAANSYTAHLLRTATAHDLCQVFSMTAEQWRSLFHKLFLQLVVLLELVNRCDALDAGTPCSNLQEPPDTTLAISTAAAPAGVACAADNWTPPVELYGAGPAACMQQLDATVDRHTRLVLLAYLHHHVPLLEACMTNYVTHQRSAPATSHWQSVAKRLQLSDLQMLHMSIGHEEYARLSKAAAAECSALVSQAATPSLLMAAAEQIEAHSKAPGLSSHDVGATLPPAAGADQAAMPAGSRTTAKQKQLLTGTGSSQGQGPSSSGTAEARQTARCAQSSNSSGEQLTAAAAAAEPAAVAEDEPAPPLDDQLRRHMQCRHLQLRMIAMYYLNTLSRLQIAHLVVSAFPYFPSLTAIAEVVHLEWQQQQQQHCLRQLQSTNEDAAEDCNDPWQQQQGVGQHMLPTAASPGAELVQQHVQQHLQQRSSLLQQQHLRWWTGAGECGVQLGDSALDQELLKQQQQMQPE